MSRGGRLAGLGESIGDALLERAGRVVARSQERAGLDSDLLESEDAYLVVFDTPGATASDVQVRYVDGGISVRVDRFREFHEGFDMKFPGRGLSLDGRVELPEEAVVEADAASATLTDHGTLEIELPKREGAPARTSLDTDTESETLDEDHADEETEDDAEAETADDAAEDDSDE